jgi:hypothetical protein
MIRASRTAVVPAGRANDGRLRVQAGRCRSRAEHVDMDTPRQVTAVSPPGIKASVLDEISSSVHWQERPDRNVSCAATRLCDRNGPSWWRWRAAKRPRFWRIGSHMRIRSGNGRQPCGTIINVNLPIRHASRGSPGGGGMFRRFAASRRHEDPADRPLPGRHKIAM